MVKLLMSDHSPQMVISCAETLHKAPSGSGWNVGRIRGKGCQFCKKTLERELTKHNVMLQEVKGDSRRPAAEIHVGVHHSERQ